MKTIKPLCQYCHRPTKEDDLVKLMCSLCRAFHGHIPDPNLRKSILRRLHKLLHKEINLRVKCIDQTQSQKPSVDRDVSLKDDREILAEKQRDLKVVKAQLDQKVKLSGQDIKNDRLLRGLTQTQYAELLGISRMHLHRIEKGLVAINGKILYRFKNVTFSGG